LIVDNDDDANDNETLDVLEQLCCSDGGDDGNDDSIIATSNDYANYGQYYRSFG